MADYKAYDMIKNLYASRNASANAKIDVNAMEQGNWTAGQVSDFIRKGKFSEKQLLDAAVQAQAVLRDKYKVYVDISDAATINATPYAEKAKVVNTPAWQVLNSIYLTGLFSSGMQSAQKRDAKQAGQVQAAEQQWQAKQMMVGSDTKSLLKDPADAAKVHYQDGMDCLRSNDQSVQKRYADNMDLIYANIDADPAWAVNFWTAYKSYQPKWEDMSEIDMCINNYTTASTAGSADQCKNDNSAAKKALFGGGN